MESDNDQISADECMRIIERLPAEEQALVRERMEQLFGQKEKTSSPSKQSQSPRAPASSISSSISTEEVALEKVKTALVPFVNKLKEAKKKHKRDVIFWWWPLTSKNVGYVNRHKDGSEKAKQSSLASHLGMTDDAFIELSKDAKLYGNYKSWERKLGFSVASYPFGSNVTWIVLDEKDDGTGNKQWPHLPPDQEDPNKKQPAWTGDAKMGYIVGTSEEKRKSNQKGRNLAEGLVSAVDGILVQGAMAALLAKAKRSRRGTKHGLNTFTIANRDFNLPINYSPIHDRERSKMNDEMMALRKIAAETQTLANWKADNAEVGQSVLGIMSITRYPSTPESRRMYSLAMAEAN